MVRDEAQGELISLATAPDHYRHWQVTIDGPIATVRMAVAPDAALRPGYQLKLNTYDLAVDIELSDLVQRLRFEHAGVKAVVLSSALDRVFCAGANIQMLTSSSHAHKVAFCKLTNETRCAIEDASASSGQTWIAALNGTAAGGGYELALACDEILLVDDHASAVSLPEVPLLAVLPGTGGLTRVVDKRGVRRDVADLFATRPDGVKGEQARAWGLVDAIAPRSRFDQLVAERAAAAVARSDRPDEGGVALPPLGATTTIGADGLRATYVDVDLDRDTAAAMLTVRGPSPSEPSSAAELVAAGARSWLLQTALELDHALLHLRFNEPELGTWALRTEGDLDAVASAEEVLGRDGAHWLAREVRRYWARTLKRLELSARSLVALIEPGSCFAGTLLELALAADRTLMLDGWREGDERAPASVRLTAANDGWYPMGNGLSRLESRSWGHTDALAEVAAHVGKDLDAATALALGLVTQTFDDLDWDDEVRLLLEERASFSPDALTAMEANLRFVGPETVETKIFGRLTAWQNWVFQRPSAVGPEGALHRFGTGAQPTFDRTRTG